MIGRRLAHYEITAHLGSGGMGDVYQATDSKLDRPVALKFLPQAFAGDPDRSARFAREAKALAALNHPNIAAIHGLDDGEGGERFLVMEFVPGSTLADRIGRTPLPLDEAIGIARQIAEALEAAHDKGVVHRDLKPANVKITPEGQVKVLDFGLAKLAGGDAEETGRALSNSPKRRFGSAWASSLQIPAGLPTRRTSLAGPRSSYRRSQRRVSGFRYPRPAGPRPGGAPTAARSISWRLTGR
jgi:serine/threonine protein kinase